MPPKQRITREMILKYAFQIVEEEGIMAVTSRSVAKGLGCSIQPIFSQFPTMEELRQATFDYACDVLVKEILTYEQLPNFFPLTTKLVINLAKNRPNLFRLIYLSDGFQGNNFLDVMMNFDSNRKLVSKMAEMYGLEESVCKDILLRSSMFLVGVCTMICVNHMEFSDENIANMMKQTVADMVKGAKENDI